MKNKFLLALIDAVIPRIFRSKIIGGSSLRKDGFPYSFLFEKTRGMTKKLKKYTLIAMLFISLPAANAWAVGAKQVAPQEKKDLDSRRDGVQVRDIYVACRYYFSKVFNTRENVSRKNICNGYFFGSASMLLLLQNEGKETDTCVPMDVSTEEIIRGFLDWSDDNQDKSKLLASEALLELLRQNYPCDEGFKPTKVKKDKAEGK